jgi:hypothetical protein
MSDIDIYFLAIVAFGIFDISIVMDHPGLPFIAFAVYA